MRAPQKLSYRSFNLSEGGEEAPKQKEGEAIKINASFERRAIIRKKKLKGEGRKHALTSLPKGSPQEGEEDF